MPRHSGLIPFPYSAPSKSPSPFRFPDWEEDPAPASPTIRLQGKPELVAHPREIISRTQSRPTSETHPYHGCQSSGLGGSPGGRVGSRQMVKSRGGTQYQLAQTSSRPPCPAPFSSKSDQFPCPGQNRQHDHQGLYQSSEGYEIEVLDAGGLPSLRLGRTLSSFPLGRTPGWNPKCGGRLAKPSTTKQHGMASSPPNQEITSRLGDA